MKIETINIIKKLIVELSDGDYENLFIPKDVDGMDESIYALLPACSPKPKTITVEEGNTSFCVKDNCLIEIATKTLIVAAQNGEIPDDGSVQVINQGAFSSVPLPQTLIIPQGVKEIGNLAFSDTNIEIVIIPSSVEKIGCGAFRNFINKPTLKRIVVDSENPNYYVESNYLIDRRTKCVVHLCDLTVKEVIIPKGVYAIDCGVFPPSLEKITLPSTIRKIYHSNLKLGTKSIECDGSEEFLNFCKQNNIVHKAYWGRD